MGGSAKGIDKNWLAPEDEEEHVPPCTVPLAVLTVRSSAHAKDRNRTPEEIEGKCIVISRSDQGV
jgi:hypothetical protein